MEVEPHNIERHYGITYRYALATFNVHHLYPIWGWIFFAGLNQDFLHYPTVYKVPEHIWAKFKDHKQAICDRLVAEVTEAEKAAPGAMATTTTGELPELPDEYVDALLSHLFQKFRSDTFNYGTETPLQFDTATAWLHDEFIKGNQRDVLCSALGVPNTQIWDEYKENNPKHPSYATFENWLTARAQPLLTLPWMTMRLGADSHTHVTYKAPVWVVAQAIREGIPDLHPGAHARTPDTTQQRDRPDDLSTPLCSAVAIRCLWVTRCVGLHLWRKDEREGGSCG